MIIKIDKLKNILKNGNEFELDVIVETKDTEEFYLPCLCFDGYISKKISKKYSKILNSKCELRNDYLIIFFDNSEKVEDFIYDVELDEKPKRKLYTYTTCN